MRSLYSGVSGLKIHQTKMDVIANNISNVNTTAYKSGRVTFSDYFSQTLSSGQSGTASRGGMNPMQVGLGANLASIDINMRQGSNQRTDRSMDAMISGEGFFIVGQGQNTYFTRDGNFGLDSYGNLVTSQGMNVFGWAAMEDSNNPGQYIASKGSVNPITLSTDQQTMPAETTKNLEAQGNVNVVSNPNNPDEPIENPTTISFFDSIGNKFTVDVKYVWDPTTKTMGMQMGDQAYLNGRRDQAFSIAIKPDTGNTASAIAPGNIEIVFTGVATGSVNYIPANDLTDPAAPIYGSLGNVQFTDDGVVNTSSAGTTNGGKFTLLVSDGRTTVDDPSTPDVIEGQNSLDGLLPAGTTFGEGGIINLDMTGITNFDNVGSTLQVQALDGTAPGSLTDISIQADGSLVGKYSNGSDRLLAFIPLAKFDNPSGLARAGGNLFQTTANSGEFNGIGTTAQDIGSSIASGQLEMSNVDIAQEFTDMIVTQRGFQANSKSITTSDEMLQELVNLKR